MYEYSGRSSKLLYLENYLLIFPRWIVTHRQQLPSPGHFLQICCNLEDQHFFQPSTDVHHQLRHLIVVGYPVVLVVQYLIGKHSGYSFLV